MSAALFFAQLAWVDGSWARNVVLEVDGAGRFSAVLSGQMPPAGATLLAGPILPSLVDAHSHAFQRAFAGLAEQRDAARDDFWSWRDRMYGVALRMNAEQLRAVAAQLYLELLQGGYTQVCEFHYLQHQPDGAPYADELTLSWSLADAAESLGIGLTILPVLYAHAGFDQQPLRPDQRRFATNARWVWAASERINAAGRSLLSAGLAIHSLRGASASDITQLQSLAEGQDLPIHIHISEQVREVEDCVAARGERPIAWLCSHAHLDRRWHLVHATHADINEITAVARTGASVVLCPGTEANLGDGDCDLPAWLGAQVPLSVGSDSQVTRSWVEELRWLEYGQRLRLQARNVAAFPPRETSTAARLFEACVEGSAAPAGLACWGLRPGARADWLVLDRRASGLLGLPDTALLSGLLFASQGTPVRDVFVAGRQIIREGRHPRQDQIMADFERCMHTLW